MVYFNKKFLVAVFFVLLITVAIYYLLSTPNALNRDSSKNPTKIATQVQTNDRQKDDLYSTLDSTEGVTTFKKYVDMLEVKSVLSETKEYTLFIPSDEAFNSWPKEILASLENDKNMLDKLVSYHIAIGKYNLGDIMPLTSLKTLNGKDVSVTKIDGKIYLNGYAVMIKTNIETKNGVIHVIDKVLMP